MIRTTALAKRVGTRLQKLRRSRELTQEALADLAGHSRNTISLIETAAVLPDLDTIEDICDALKLTLGEFFRFRRK